MTQFCDFEDESIEITKKHYNFAPSEKKIRTKKQSCVILFVLESGYATVD